jgi:hypothetical protein
MILHSLNPGRKRIAFYFKNFQNDYNNRRWVTKVVLECNPEFAAKTTIPKIQLLNPDEFIEHGTVDELQQYCKIDVKSFSIESK